MPQYRVLPIYLLTLAACAHAADPLTNTQEESIPRLSPADAAASMQLPDGFRASVFAAEPDVHQPIGMAFDARGRLWVAENHTYAESKVNYDLNQSDRIIILEDADGDGKAEKRTVFADGFQRLTSVEVGFGGVWVMAPPALYFIPDRDGDDRPDGPPQVVLDGWDDSAARHNFTNGLRWGPDGWLYGRNGILATSRVGLPGATAEERTPLNCGIWRYHPTRKVFEIVCVGTTNPWGMDWDAHGQMFFINTVIGHLWHVIPGAHFRRMYGEDLRPTVYKLIEQTADHFHWDTSAEEWTAQRKGVSEGTSKAGGGHAHSGLMIYLGDSWPEAYRGELFTVNLHGRRLNQDHLARAGATYVGQHRPDFMQSGDEWFRAIDLAYGPDGGVYLLDWSDIGECHENDGVHRTSGRVFKLDYGPAKKSKPFDLAKESNAALVKLHEHRNEWYSRQARRLLQERAAEGQNLSESITALEQLATTTKESTLRARALGTLTAMGSHREAFWLQMLTHADEHARVRAIQTLVDAGPPAASVAAALQQLAAQEQNGLVLTFLVSAAQRMTADDRLPILEKVATHAEFAEDRVLPLMTWYGLEPVALDRPAAALASLKTARFPIVAECLARRMTAELEQRPEYAAALVKQLQSLPPSNIRKAALEGMALALRGWQRASAPAGWNSFAASVTQSPFDESEKALVRELSVVFGDGRAMEEVRKLAADRSQPIDNRRQAIRSLVTARAPGLIELLQGLLTDRDLAEEGVRGLATLDLTASAPLFITKYRSMPRTGKDASLAALTSRVDTAGKLLDAVTKEEVPRPDMTPALLRQMQLLGNADLVERVSSMWPDQRLIARDRLAQMAQLRERLTPPVLAAADLSHGRVLYEKTCGKCHKLFGEGGTIGPELTGAQRGNLNYLLENIIDPSAAVAVSFRMSIIALKDGRVVAGVVVETSTKTLTLQTPQEKVIIERANIEEIRHTVMSLMPDGQLNALTPDDVRDLFGYLMITQPPAKPTAGGGQ